jgi:ABC-2 type transport system permease protein
MSIEFWKNNFIKTTGFAYRNLIIFIRSIFTLFEVIFWPLFWLISLGLLGNFIKLEKEYLAFIIIGALCFNVMNVCQLDVAFSLLFDLWSKSIKHVFLAPIKPNNFIIGATLIGILRGILVWLITSILSFYLFKFNILSAGIFPNFHFLIGIFLNSTYIGILVCIFLLLFGYRAEVAAWSITSVIILICGVYYPANILPKKLYILSRFIPLSYFLEYFRSFFGFPVDRFSSLILGYFLSITYIILNTILLKISIERAKKTGIIMRMSE